MASDSIDHPYGSDELKKSERLKWMAQNSGMEFAANPSEFDSRVIYIYIYIYELFLLFHNFIHVLVLMSMLNIYNKLLHLFTYIYSKYQ